jgi:hypothetical protein
LTVDRAQLPNKPAAVDNEQTLTGSQCL